MKSVDFIPNARTSVSKDCTLCIIVCREQGDSYVYSAFYDEQEVRTSQVTKSLVNFNSRGHAYFTKCRQRYYLNDFTMDNLLINKG